MSKWFEVKVQTLNTYLVEVKNEEGNDDAEAVISDDVFEWDEMTSEEVPADQVETTKGFVDKNKIYAL
jgi:hypothetical protein